MLLLLALDLLLGNLREARLLRMFSITFRANGIGSMFTARGFGLVFLTCVWGSSVASSSPKGSFMTMFRISRYLHPSVTVFHSGTHVALTV